MGLGEEKEGSRSGSSMRKGTGKPRRRGLCEREKMWRKMLEGKSKKKGGKLGKLCFSKKKKTYSHFIIVVMYVFKFCIDINMYKKRRIFRHINYVAINV